MKIAVVSTSRADMGALTPVAAEISLHQKMEFIKWNRKDSISATIAVICGDRFETVELAFKLNLSHIPIAHLSGGDITEGSQDDCFRHAITKLSHLHFPTNEESYKRILQMGEEPWRVHNFGSPSIDGIKSCTLFDRATALKFLDLEDGPFVLVSLHPNTFGKTDFELSELYSYLMLLPEDTKRILIGPNADAEADKITYQFIVWSETMPNTKYIKTVPRVHFLSLMKHCVEMVGNSSAMLYEAPTLGTKTVMIGDRQQGRQPVYGDGRSAKRIAKVICSVKDPQALLRKKFVDLNYGRPTSRYAANR